MNKKNKHINMKPLSQTFVMVACLLFLLFTECVVERFEIDYNIESATLYLNLDIPCHNDYDSKAMSVANESSIDYDNIHVLVFEEIGMNEVFRFTATITALAPLQITLELPINHLQGRCRLVVIANTDITDIAEGTPKNEALNSFIFDCVGKWNTSNESFAHIPMWGEYRLFTIKENMSINVLMHRALARIDVGLLFKFNNPDPVTGLEYPDKDSDKESVWGLNNFKIKDVRVYRTLNKAYAASSANKMAVNEVITPNIPVSARYNSDSGADYVDLESADKNPLVYTLPAGSDNYIRGIYIPESLRSEIDASSDNIPCLVVGGYFGKNNTTDISYYRADFASYSNGAIMDYLPLLRNHRYVFDIRNVGGLGFKEPEHALNSISADMILDVQEWNELPFNYHVQGDYFFSIDTREVMLDASIPKDMEKTIYYRTNLDLDPATNPFIYKWVSSKNTSCDYFDITIDYQSKTLIFAVKEENLENTVTPITDCLILKIQNYQFTIDVSLTNNNNPNP